jgi:hypothetical protein
LICLCCPECTATPGWILTRQCYRAPKRAIKRGCTIIIFEKFLLPKQHAWLRRTTNPLSRRIATRMDVVFEDVLREVPSLKIISDTPLLAGSWFRAIVLQKQDIDATEKRWQ